MFHTKKGVDRHVQEVLRKIKNEHERNLRCYNIAQQYYKVRDYESAKHYLALYLSVKEDSPLAHKLQGQIWEGLGEKVRALNAYKTSLEFEANQPELVLKMCELLCETDLAMDSDRAHYWCERCSDLFPHDPAVFRLKEKLLKVGGKADSHAFEELINSEMKARPNDVSVRTRLMRLYLETGRTRAAFDHAVELESNNKFPKQLAWYKCFAQICQRFADEFPSQVDWRHYCTWVSVLDKVASLSMYEPSPPKKMVDCVQAIFSMDQVLFKACRVTAPKEHSHLYKHFKLHMSAQLALHMATFILKRAKKEPSNWRKDDRHMVPTVLFLALTPPPDQEATWIVTLNPNFKRCLSQWTDDAFYRVSQAGYTLLALADDAGKQFTEKVIHMASSGNWRERTFQRIFAVLDHRACVNTSHFVNSDLLAKVPVKLPTHDVGFLRTRQLVPVYEKVRGSLHHLVWLGLEVFKQSGKKLPSDFHTFNLTKLKFTTPILSNLSSETLSVLDVDAFLYATVLCAAANLEEEINSGFHSSEIPVTLPADIANFLCTQEQISWWSAAQQVNSQQFSESTNMIVVRQQLQRGLEVVRVEHSHGLDVQLIVKLARTFADRASTITGTSAEQAAVESRALLYWHAAIPLLERMERNQAVCISSSKLFEYKRKELSTAEVCSLLEEGRYFVACQLMKTEQHERAIEAFKPLRSPYASYNQALIYKKLAAAELEDRPREEITSEMRSKHVILLSKAKECLKITYDRIRIDRHHPLHDKLNEHLSEVESALSRIEPDHDMDLNILGTPRSLDLSLQQLGMSFHSSAMNHSEGDANLTEPSLSSVGSPAGGDMSRHPPHHYQSPRVNGRHKQSSTPRRQNQSMTHTEYKRQSHNGDLINLGQLMQIQTLQNDVKSIHEKIELIMETMNDIRRDLNKIKPAGLEDLYGFGDEEDYPDEALGGQYPPTFISPFPTPTQSTPTIYPQPPRGVHGTSTVTYGAPPPTQQPPVIPIIPTRMPLDPALTGYQQPQNLGFYNQGTFPFTEPRHLPDFMQLGITKPPVIPQPPQAPVNVVITTSDILPTGPPIIQPTLSVTIPPQHRLGTLAVGSTPVSTPAPAPVQPVTPVVSNTSTQPHNFQITMPASATIPNLEKSPIVPNEVESEDETEIAYDPCPDFKPIIPLPNEVNVTTGEEDDDTLFENRAKLFRFVEKEWKERGIGVIKILKNRNTDKVRLLMRRDQVHKVCANHLIRSDMDLTYLSSSNKALVWVANDFAEEVVQLEKFCVRFKTPAEAARFKEVFDDSKIKYGQSPVKPKRDNENKQIETSSAPGNENKPLDTTGKVNLGGFTFTSPPKLKEPTIDKTKQKEEVKKETPPAPSPFASFTFTPQKSTSDVTFSNNSNKQQVSSQPLFAGLNSTQNKHNLFNKTDPEISNQPKPIGREPLFKSSNETSPKAILKEATLPPVQFTPSVSTNVTNDSTATKKSAVDGNTVNQNKPLFSFTQSFPSNTTKETPKSILKEPPASSLNKATAIKEKTSPASKHVLFQDPTVISPSQQTPTLAALLSTPKTQVVDFAALSKLNESTPAAFSNNKANGFEGAGSKVFGGNRSRNDSEGDPVDEFVPSAEFKPVIPLPELVEVKTGEENELILFNERAKLMRFDPDTKEWKERGLGQMKILKDPSSGVSRFLMRREQVHKICCNHRIIQSLELRASPSSEKAWTWYAVDYSEGETRNELFAVRFKTVELAKSFKETVDNVQKKMREEGTSKRSCPDSAPQEETTSASPHLTSPVTSPVNVWTCQSCLFPNANGRNSCLACIQPKTDALPKLTDLFRPKTGSWECKACYTVNGSKDSNCVCCDSPKEKSKSPGPVAPPVSKNTVPTTVSDKTTSLAEMFKPKVGSWECGGCLVRNDADKTVCPACGTAKPGHENDVNQTAKPSFTFGSSSYSFGMTPSNDKGGFTFGIKPNEDAIKSSVTSGFKPQSAATTVSITTPVSSLQNTNSFTEDKVSSAISGFSFGGSISTSKASSPFTFAPKGEVVTSSADSTTKASGAAFRFGSPSTDASSFTFGSLSAPKKTSEDTDQFSFGQSGKFEFTFSGVKPSLGHRSPKSPSTGKDTDSEPEDLDDEEIDPVFQPIVPLPDKVPLTTGEEDEEVLYSHRAKLFRFALGEWKERGIGDIKILRHNKTHKIRLLMRREPILKICLNHWLTSELTFTQKDDKTWLWSAPDFAEGQITTEQFCLRLKTPEIAKEFKDAIDSAKGELDGGQSPVKLSSAASDSADTHEDELEIVYEAKVPEDLRTKALKLQLPPNFYSYLDAPPCRGCAGCETDSEEENLKTKSAVTSEKAGSKAQETNKPVAKPFEFVFRANSISTTTTATTTTSSPFATGFTSSTFKLPSTAAESVGNTITTTSVPLNASIFGGSPLFQSQSSTKSIFGNTENVPINKPAVATLFGSSALTPSDTKSTTLSNSPTTPSLQPKVQVTSINNVSTATTKVNSIFGGMNSQSPASIFSTPTSTNDSPSSKASPFFGNLGTFQSPPKSVFGGTSETQNSMFGTSTTQSSLFGGISTSSQSSIFGTPNPTKTIFGSTSATPTLFGAAATVTPSTTKSSLFGSGSSGMLFGTPNTTAASENSGPSFLFKDTTTFSDFASKEKDFTTAKTPTSNFKWEGAGATIFNTTGSKKKAEGSDEESDGEEENADTTHDPMFEPIVPLPNVIEVRTGEEDEEKEFCQRAKFFRYDVDNKEWKERGTGEMKILRHREKNTYRLLLRRDQVYKVVCNQLITADLDLQNLATSDKSYCWAAMNMAEEYPEPRLEKVAVRFKNSDIAEEFKAKVEECITKVKAIKKKSSGIREADLSIEEVSTGSIDNDEEEGEVEGEYEEEEEYEAMFEKQATLFRRGQDGKWSKTGQGQLILNYIQGSSQYPETNIIFKKPHGEHVVISLGHDSTAQRLTEKEVSWLGHYETEQEMQEFKSQFSLSDDADEFLTTFNEAIELSQTFDSSYVETETED